MIEFQFARLRRRLQPKLDFTPMIDVLFNLLIFIVVSTTFLTSSGINLNLARGANVEQTPSGVEITVHKDGTIYYKDAQGESLVGAFSELAARVSQALERDQNTPFAINADRETPYQTVISVLDAVKTGGSERVSLGIEPLAEAAD